MRHRKTDKWRALEKRGVGYGKDYTPWIKVHEFGSKGRVSRVPGWLTERVHQLMSDLENETFLNLQYNPDVVDIREQFPLLPIEQTILIAKELCVPHPPKTRKEKTVMTTDFLVTVKTYDEYGAIKLQNVAISVKYKKDLEDKRTREKLCIEEHYWRMENIPFRVVTEEDIDHVQARNLELMYQSYWWDRDKSYCQEEIDCLLKQFKDEYRQKEKNLLKAMEALEKKYDWCCGEGISFLFYLITHRRVKVDMSKRINVYTLQVEFYE